MSNWLPMEDAPRDGTPILLRLPEPIENDATHWEDDDIRPRFVTIGQWCGEGNWRALDSEMNFGYRGSGEWWEARKVEPDGWMPVPAPHPEAMLARIHRAQEP